MNAVIEFWALAGMCRRSALQERQFVGFQTGPGRKSFSLIELLVVVAIISVLVAILLPSIQRAREIAKIVVCNSNLRNLGLAVQVYSDDNADYLPFGYNPASGIGADPRLNNWMPHIHPYVYPNEAFWPADYHLRIDGVFRCPVINPDNHANPGFPISYIWNDELHIDRNISGTTEYVNDQCKRTDLLRPARTFLITENIWRPGRPQRASVNYAVTGFVAYDRHGWSTDNLLFGDGHTETCRTVWDHGGWPFLGTGFSWKAE